MTMNKHTQMGDDTMENDDLIERCDFCDNPAVHECSLCGATVCDYHIIHDPHVGDEYKHAVDECLIERCGYCGNDAPHACERCGTWVCDMHAIFGVCAACAIVGHIKRIDMAIHVFTYGDLPMNTYEHNGGKR